MDIDKKIEILAEFTKEALVTEIPVEFREFIKVNDLGSYLSLAQNMELANLNPSAYEFIEETYSELCNFLDVDESQEYEDYEDFWENAGWGEETRI